MTMTNWDQWRDTDLYDTHGEKVGTIRSVYLDDETDQPEWLGVNTGMFGTNETFVPIEGTTFQRNRPVTRYSRDEIKDAPNVDADRGHLSAEDEARLYQHFGRKYTPYQRSAKTTGNTGTTTGTTTTTSAGKRGDQTVAQATVRNEQVQTAETEQVRLRKHGWTEPVPVQREEVVGERHTDSDVQR